MPYFNNAPEGMNEIMEKAYQNCMDGKNASKERCSKIAIAAAKKKYKKVGKKWIRKQTGK